MPVARKARTNDQYDLESRLELLIHQHLADIEQNPEMYASKDRLATIQYVGMFLNRKYGWGDPEVEGVGSAVRKYAGAFRTAPTTHAAGARTGGARAGRIAAVADPDDEAAA